MLTILWRAPACVNSVEGLGTGQREENTQTLTQTQTQTLNTNTQKNNPTVKYLDFYNVSYKSFTIKNF